MASRHSENVNVHRERSDGCVQLFRRIQSEVIIVKLICFASDPTGAAAMNSDRSGRSRSCKFAARGATRRNSQRETGKFRYRAANANAG